MPRPHPPSSPAPRYRSLWFAGLALATLLLTLVAGNFALPRDRRLTADMVGHDFLAFYTAGTFVREGRTRDLYRLDEVRAFQHDLVRRENLAVGDSYGPFWNPPFYAWVFVPLAALPYPAALVTWEAINLACLLGATTLLVRLLRGAPAAPPGSAGYPPPAADCRLPTTWHTWALLPLLLLTSMPLVQALTHGQNTLVSLLLLAATVTLWRGGRGFAAGAVAGLLFYKPQLGMVVAVALVLTVGWRALAGLTGTGLFLLLVTRYTMPGALSGYRHLLPANLHTFQVDNVYLWDRHVTLRAFWRLLLQGRAAGPMGAVATVGWLATLAVVAAGLAWAGWHVRRATTAALTADAESAAAQSATAARDWLIAAVVLAMPLLMPFYFDYDLLLAAVAAVLCARAAHLERYARAASPPLATDNWQLATLPQLATPLSWSALYAWLFVNATVARLTRVNGTVMLLALVWVLVTVHAVAAARRALRDRAARALSDDASAGRLGALAAAA